MLKVYRSIVRDGVVELVSPKMPNVGLKNGWSGLVLQPSLVANPVATRLTSAYGSCYY